MDTSSQIQESKPKRAFPLFAASYSLFVSCGAAVVACIVVAALRSSANFSSNQVGFLSAILFFTFLSSLLMGIVSLFGIRRFGVGPILWRALIGIAISSFFGLYSGFIFIWGYLYMGII